MWLLLLSTTMIPFGSGSLNCSSPELRSFGYCDPHLPIDARVSDLVGRMSLAEKISNMRMTNSDSPMNTSGCARLGLPPLVLSECLHGLGNDGDDLCVGKRCPSVFPAPSALGCTFNKSLWRAVGTAVGREARALRNEGKAAGLVCWAPVVNLVRDARWGRADESPSEDPLTVGSYGTEYVKGLQQDGVTKHLQVAATLKHFAAYGMDDWCATSIHSEDAGCADGGPDYSRNGMNSIVSQQDLDEYYLPPFGAAIQEGRARSIMASENAINGQGCSTTTLLKEVVRGKFNFSGYIVSDCGEIDDSAHHDGVSRADAASMAVHAGNDMECTDNFPGDFERYLAKDIAAGKGNESDVDLAVGNILRVQFELGELDEDVSYRHLTVPETVDTGEHQQLAKEAAAQSLVLLQNRELDDGSVASPPTLPLMGPLCKHRISPPCRFKNIGDQNISVAVIGPYGKLTQDLLGEADYVSANYRVDSHSLVDALAARSQVKVYHEEGCTFKDNCNSSIGIPKAIATAQRADVVVFALGLVSCGVHAKTTVPTECESEGHDRFSIELPGSMPQLVQAVTSSLRRTVPVVCVLFHGGSIAIEPLISHCDAILDPHHPGQAGATAVVDAMFGELNPSGRLATTIYPTEFTTSDRPNMTDMRLRGGPATAGGLPPSLGVTYLHYPANRALFEFGHGLGFSTLVFSWEEGEQPSGSAAVGKHAVSVHNKQGPPGSTAVLGFVSTVASISGFPQRRLFDFTRTTTIEAGHCQTVVLNAPREAFAVMVPGSMEGTSLPVVAEGEYELLTGDPHSFAMKKVHVP